MQVEASFGKFTEDLAKEKPRRYFRPPYANDSPRLEISVDGDGVFSKSRPSNAYESMQVVHLTRRRRTGRPNIQGGIKNDLGLF